MRTNESPFVGTLKVEAVQVTPSRPVPYTGRDTCRSYRDRGDRQCSRRSWLRRFTGGAADAHAGGVSVRRVSIGRGSGCSRLESRLLDLPGGTRQEALLDP
jgi:hypothetical protein